MSRRDVTSQVEFGLYFLLWSTLVVVLQRRASATIRVRRCTADHTQRPSQRRWLYRTRHRGWPVVWAAGWRCTRMDACGCFRLQRPTHTLKTPPVDEYLTTETWYVVGRDYNLRNSKDIDLEQERSKVRRCSVLTVNGEGVRGSMMLLCFTTVHWSTDFYWLTWMGRRDWRRSQCRGREVQCGSWTKINWTQTAHITRLRCTRIHYIHTRIQSPYRCVVYWRPALVVAETLCKNNKNQ